MRRKVTLLYDDTNTSTKDLQSWIGQHLKLVVMASNTKMEVDTEHKQQSNRLQKRWKAIGMYSYGTYE